MQAEIQSFLVGPTLTLHHAVPLLEAAAVASNGTASVINISSVAAQKPAGGMTVYSMAKAAIDMLTRAAAFDLGVK
jgi:NAD(P)-dependent dehydrogenase (short-subunit alcohol dehydrogenase family)